jgi:Domain of unknown function (DUF4351)
VRTGRASIAHSQLQLGLLLEKGLINQVLRKDIMQQSAIYQEWKEEFLQEGRQEGAMREAQALILRQLSRRVGSLSSKTRSASATKVVRRSNPSLSDNWNPWARHYWIFLARPIWMTGCRLSVLSDR